MTNNDVKALITRLYYDIGKKEYKEKGGKKLPCLDLYGTDLERFSLYSLSDVSYYYQFNNDGTKVDFIVFLSIDVYIDDLIVLISYMRDSNKFRKNEVICFAGYVIIKAIYRLLEFEKFTIIPSKYTEKELDKLIDDFAENINKTELHSKVMDYLYLNSKNSYTMEILEWIDLYALNPLSRQPVYISARPKMDKYTESVLNREKHELDKNKVNYLLSSEGIYLNRTTNNIKLNPLL